MSVSPRLRVIASSPPELVVHDEPGPCAYLEGHTWRLPLRLPVRSLSRAEFGLRLAAGDRRQGRLLYRPTCADCAACEPIRVDAESFHPSGSQRRALLRGDREIRMQLGPVMVDEARLALYQHHKAGRCLLGDESATDRESYQSFLGDSCCETFEIRYWVGDQLLGIAVVDRAHDALSAVYFYWDPQLKRLSPGTYSILKQIELCKRLRLRYLYLGLYIEGSRPMSYKDRFRPHERLIAGRWQRFE